LQSQWYHANTILPLKEENLYITAKMTQNGWSQSVHYKEVPLHVLLSYLTYMQLGQAGASATPMS